MTTDSNNSQTFSSFGFVLSVIGNAYLAWFFLEPILSGKIADFELLGISLIIIEMMALICDGSIMVARDAAAKYPDKASRFDQYWRSALGIIISLLFVAGVSSGLHNYLYLWVFFISLLSKLLMHFFIKIDYNFKETVWQLAILTITSLAAVFSFAVWGFIYYSVIIIRSFYQLEKASKPAVKAVIFDQDGVIADTEKINVASALFAFDKLGVTITEPEKAMIVGIHPTDYKDTLLAKYQVDFDEYNKYKREYYYQALESVEFFTKTIEIIKKLQQKNIPLGLVTSSKRANTEKMMARAGLTGVFTVMVCFEDTSNRKPAPDCYLICASKLGFSPSECLAVEDSYPGLLAAKASGATCFVIPNDATKNQDFSQADKVIDYERELDFKLFEEVLGI